MGPPLTIAGQGGHRRRPVPGELPGRAGREQPVETAIGHGGLEHLGRMAHRQFPFRLVQPVPAVQELEGHPLEGVTPFHQRVGRTRLPGEWPGQPFEDGGRRRA